MGTARDAIETVLANLDAEVTALYERDGELGAETDPAAITRLEDKAVWQAIKALAAEIDSARV